MFITNRAILFLILLLGVLLAGPSFTRAQDLQPLPELSKGFDLQAYAATTDTIKKDLSDADGVAFEVALPKTWIERSTLGQSYGEMVRYDGPPLGEIRPYFSLKRLQMKRENSARHELIAYMLKQGYVLRSLKETDDRNVEALYVVTQAGDSFAVRTRARIIGPSILLAEYALPVHAWDQLRDEQTFSTASFKFLKDSDEMIEKRIERSYFKALRFYYPASWVFVGESAPQDNIAHISIANMGEGGIEAGRIRISVASQQSLKDTKDDAVYTVDVAALLKEVRKIYEDKGYLLSKPIESGKPKVNLPVTFAAMDTYALRRIISNYDTAKEQPVTHELKLAVFRTEGNTPKVYIAELFTPSREQDIYLWSINTRAFDIVLESIQ